MGAEKIFGGLLALIGGIFILIPILIIIPIFMSWLGAGPAAMDLVINWILLLIFAILAVVAGIMGLASKGGGALALVIGLIAIVVGLLWSFGILPIGYEPASGFDLWILGSIVSKEMLFGITIEAILITFGGVIMLASSSD